MDIFLETYDHTHGMKWDTVHITWRLWVEPINLLKSNRYIKYFCQPECCQYKIIIIIKLTISNKKRKTKNFLSQFSLLIIQCMFPFSSVSTQILPHFATITWCEPMGSNSLEPTIKLKPTQESQESSQEDLDPLKSCFKNLESSQNDLDPLKSCSKNLDSLRTPQRVCLW